MRLAILADIHGNLPALQAVMVELERLQPDQVIVDGDLINAVPFSSEVVDLVRKQDWVVVRGNHEFYYLDYGTPRAVAGSHDPERWGQLHWLVEKITTDQAAYLGMLPDDRTLYLPGARPLRVTHGVPGRNRVGFNNYQSEEAIASELHAVGEAVLISAHTHVQVDRVVREHGDRSGALEYDPHLGVDGQTGEPRRWRVINPGSVGLPLTGEPFAYFALLEPTQDTEEFGGWRVTFHRASYDRRPALAAFTTSGMLAAGGVMSELFYWELVTAKPEIIRFYRWAYDNGLNPDAHRLPDLFRHYKDATGRDRYVRERDPLNNASNP
jgi:predicted phosphodiesterase